MYAIVETGGKQYKVTKDEVIDVEKLVHKPEGSACLPAGRVWQPNSQSQEPKDEITFNNVLLIADGDDIKIGAPFVPGAKVMACVVRNFKGKKVLIFKFRRRKSSKTTKGHRQQLTKVRIKEILPGY